MRRHDIIITLRRSWTPTNNTQGQAGSVRNITFQRTQSLRVTRAIMVLLIALLALGTTRHSAAPQASPRDNLMPAHTAIEGFNATAAEGSTVPETPATAPARESDFTERKAVLSSHRAEHNVSMHFNDVDITQLLQQLASMTGLNLVMGTGVEGKASLHLQEVPWQEALESIIQSQGLAYRLHGQVLMIAHPDTIAALQKQTLRAQREALQQQPLHTAHFRTHYLDVMRLVKALGNEPASGDQTAGTQYPILSPRGHLLADERTNTLIVRDTSTHIEAVEDLIARLDVPVRQVMIEARIVIARQNFTEDLGVRWRGMGRYSQKPDFALGQADGLDVLLPTSAHAPGVGQMAFGYIGRHIAIDLELNALEAQGYGEIISQPKLITSNRTEAVIRSGQQLPYTSLDSDGNEQVEFKDAVLALQVTPEITRDDKILMQLKINKDARGEQTRNGNFAIETNAIETQVLVNDSETLVIGGILSSEDMETLSKIPVLGDIPWLGALFRHSAQSREKVELLVFITPRLLRADEQADLAGEFADDTSHTQYLSYRSNGGR